MESPEAPQRTVNSFGMEFIEIPAGRFMMGSTEGEPDEQPVHLVEIIRPFFIGVTEVSGWELFTTARSMFPRERSDTGGFRTSVGRPGPLAAPPSIAHLDVLMGKLQANRVAPKRRKIDRAFCINSWNEANQLALTLSEYDPDYDYRLPTEAEWEYACRAMVNMDKPDADDTEVIQPYDERLTGIEPVRLSTPNAFGLHDMLRNAGEYCADWYDPVYYQHSPQHNPQGPPTGSSKVVRGMRSEGGGRYSAWRRDPVPLGGDDKIQVGVRLVLEEVQR